MTKEQKPSTNVLIDYATNLTQNEVADFLEKIAAKIREEGEFTFVQNEQDIPITFSDHIKTEIEYKQKGERHTFEIELKWYENKNQGKIKIV